MILSELIREQVFGATVMFGAGIAIAFMYQVLRCACRLSGCGRIAAGVLEMIFWVCAAAFVWKFLYYCTHGKLSMYVICAFASGVILWKICFCDIIYKICTFLETKWKTDKEHGKKEKKQSV